MNEIGARTPFYEFFAGAGMARIGLGLGWTCLMANDIDPAKCRSYAANFGREGMICNDVARLTTTRLPGRAHLAWASFPCQDLSLAGDRAGLGAARSGTFWAFWRLMQALRVEGRAPRVIVVENVVGLLTSHGGCDFDAICEALTDTGYRFGAAVIDAALFLPQSRERVFIVAVDEKMHVPAALIASGPMGHSIRQCWSRPARVNTIRCGFAFRSRRRATRSSPISLRTARPASIGTRRPRPRS